MTDPHDRKLLKLWREAAMLRAGEKCALCPNTDRLNCHHYFGRKNRQLRWDIDNAVILCYTHHVGGKYSAHNDPEWFRERMLYIRGQEWLDKIKVKSRQEKGLVFEEIRDKLEAIINKQ